MGKLTARLIIEVMGRPPENVSEALNTIVVKIGSEKGTRVEGKKYYEPKKIKDAENLYTAFAEVEAEFDSIHDYFGVLFNYMPSNSEIVNPEKLKTANSDINMLSNSILTRLHNYDAIAKRLVGERNILINKIKSLGGDLKLDSSTEAPEEKTIEEIKKGKKRKAKTKSRKRMVKK